MTGPADLIRDFVNTFDVESENDDLSSPAELTVWMTEHGLIASGERAVDRDLDVAVHLREGLRTALRLNHDEPDGPIPDELDSALSALPLRVTIERGAPGLAPAVSGVPGGLARIAALIPAAHADGTWPRLKVCVESTCQWAFLDSSKNRSRAWCSMRVCGNRTKTRAYRARRRAEGSTGSS